MSKLIKLKEDPELLKELEQEISALSGAVRRMLAGPLKRRAIIVLIKDSLTQTSGIGTRDIDTIISVIEDLDNQYLKKKIKGP